jgi:outer membrane protein assembly factor BamE (lipoprotein component of BamABCDE complex)
MRVPILPVAVILAITCICAGVEFASQAAAPAPSPVTTEASTGASEVAPAEKHFTKAEFERYTYGKTKSQIRLEFGPPAAVHDSPNEWYYPDLPIYDAEAGIRVAVSLRFAGLEGTGNFVAEARF